MRYLLFSAVLFSVRLRGNDLVWKMFPLFASALLDIPSAQPISTHKRVF